MQLAEPYHQASASQVERDRLILWTFIVLAILARASFWLYTGRVWEDAYITLTPARNAWEGLGLTHHASEPRVHSFTSPISVLIPLIGESVGQGLFLIRLVSVLISGVAVYFAHRIVTTLKLTLFAQVAVLSYVSLDYLQIFFGTAGMETQIATTVMLMVIWFFISQQYTWLGVALGLAMLCRPEFAVLFPVVGLWMLIYAPREIPRVAAMSILVAAPWFLFATLYYGSPIPNTIVAKKNAFLRDVMHEELATPSNRLINTIF